MNPRIGLVISTLNDGIFRVKKMLPPDADEIVIVHQYTDETISGEYEAAYKELVSQDIKLITLKGKGLSRSRNTGLAQAASDYLLICDDDTVFEENCISILKSSIQDHPEADIFTFMTRTPDGRPYKKYRNTSYQHTKRSTVKVSSVEILIRRNWLIQSNSKFDERFGLGTSLPTGEEYIFLSDAVKQGALLIFIPKYIVVHPYESSGKQFTDAMVRAKGAVFARTYGWKFWFVNALFALKKYDHYKKDLSLLKFLKLIYRGSFELRKS